jgi:electron transport complex protein RnfA
MDFKNLLFIIMSAVFVNNYVLQRFLGICPFLGVSKKLDQASGMSIAVIFVMMLATAVTWPIQRYLLDPNDMGYLQTVVFILVIAALVQLVEITLKKYMPALYRALGIYLPLITTNCAVLGVTVLNITGPFVGQDTPYTFLQSMANSFGSGLGFFLAMVIFAGIRTRTESCEAPESFKGLPITLVSASILAAAFNGFAGVVETLFG